MNILPYAPHFFKRIKQAGNAMLFPIDHAANSLFIIVHSHVA